MMRRLSLLLALAVIVATIMIVSAMPAMAKNSGDHDGKPPSTSGNSGKSGNGGAAVFHQGKGGSDVVNKQGLICHSCGD